LASVKVPTVVVRLAPSTKVIVVGLPAVRAASPTVAGVMTVAVLAGLSVFVIVAVTSRFPRRRRCGYR
jgi:hypothetical protein